MSAFINQWLDSLIDYWPLARYEDGYLQQRLLKLLMNPETGDDVERIIFRELKYLLKPEQCLDLSKLFLQRRRALAPVPTAGYAEFQTVPNPTSSVQEPLASETTYHPLVLADEAALQQQREQEQQAEQRREQARQRLLAQLRSVLQTDFLQAATFFQQQCTPYCEDYEFEVEKLNFIEDWAKEQLGQRLGHKHLPDDEQMAAIGAVFKHTLVTARAGSGKTTTMVNRALFLMQHCKVQADEILLLAFNRKAAAEIRKRLLCLLAPGAEPRLQQAYQQYRAAQAADKATRLKLDDNEVINTVAAELNIRLPYVMTFHALAYALVHPEESLLYDDPENNLTPLSRVVQRIIDDLLQEEDFRNEIRQLMLVHFKEDWESILQGKALLDKATFLAMRRAMPQESLNGEMVKSFGEKRLANFLFEHDIAYRYEQNHWWNGTNYRPDFTLYKAPNQGVIIEYFGLAGQPGYDDMSAKKRRYWATKKDWTLLECTPTDIHEAHWDNFCAYLKAELQAHGFACERLSEEQIWQRIRERAIGRFTQVAVSFIGRCRKNNLSLTDIQLAIGQYSTLHSAEARFLRLIPLIYQAYLQTLEATGDEDFDGLMQKAAAAVYTGTTVFKRKTESGHLQRLRYVGVDEYQDFSELFHQLIQAMLLHNPGLKLFCVGDDWQAINGFAGSNLKFFSQFVDYLNPTESLSLLTNYRSAASIVQLGNRLMGYTTTDSQAAKAHQTHSGRITLVELNQFKPLEAEQQRHNGDVITPVLIRLINQSLAKGQEVVLLARRNSVPWFVQQPKKPGEDERRNRLEPYLDFIRSFFPAGLQEQISISTTHKYKGLEKQTVIVLDAIDSLYPLIHPDWIFFRMLGDTLEKLVEDERRLFYVALTRAIEHVVIITDSSMTSPFVDELKAYLQPINWDDYPPIAGPSQQLTVRVSNRNPWERAGTYNIKDLLKASGYKWQTTHGGNWSKVFTTEQFTLETLQNEVWATKASAIAVRLIDDNQQLIAHYEVEQGQWQCLQQHDAADDHTVELNPFLQSSGHD